VAENLSSLSEDEVQQLVRLIECLESSAFDFLELEVGNMKVVLGKGNPPELAVTGATPAPTPTVAPLPAPAAAVTPVPASSAAAPSAAPAAPETAAPGPAAGEVEVCSPMMGIFYAQPEPGAPPFVTVGTSVHPDTTVALVEVMKMFNAVPAGVEGTVVAVLVENSQLVEYGQALFRVKPA
jgi:acetyl-CoA carboxylase biotin carboxyl carrier protein